MAKTDWRRSPKRITYPTGMTVDQYTLQNPKGTLRIYVEVFVRPGRHSHIGDDNPGDVTVTGSVIPKGAKGFICHESLPLRNFRAKWHGNDGALRNAKALAWKWYEALLPDAA